jgi:hypothetical protein
MSNNNITCEIIKRLDLFEIFEYHFNYEYKKKKSSKYGRLYNTPYGYIWARYDYKSGIYFYTNLDEINDNGTLIDWIQNHIINEKNLGKVKKYISENIL